MAKAMKGAKASLSVVDDPFNDGFDEGPGKAGESVTDDVISDARANKDGSWKVIAADPEPEDLAIKIKRDVPVPNHSGKRNGHTQAILNALLSMEPGDSFKMPHDPSKPSWSLTSSVLSFVRRGKKTGEIPHDREFRVKADAPTWRIWRLK